MMRKTLYISLIGIGLWMTNLPGQAQQTIKVRPTSATVHTIERSINKIGGKATLQKYFCGTDDTSEHDDIDQLNQVATGAKQWVDLAVKMLKYSDAGCSEGLQSYLGAAMQKQPRNVLPYVGKSSLLAPDRICLPFISDEISDAEALREVRRSKAALQAVKDKTLNKQCQACLARVNGLEKKILADMAKKK